MIDWTQFYIEVKGWQTSIGSLLGFAALTWGALYNFKLNRRRDQLLRSEEVIAIASAMYGEILLLRQNAARLAQFVGLRSIKHGFTSDGDFDEYFREMIEIPTPLVFPALAPKIGMLPPSIALEISKFYSRIEEAQSWLPRLQENPARKYSYSVASVLRPAIDAVNLIVPALREIETLTGIEPAKYDTNMKDALTALDMEEEFYAEQREMADTRQGP